VGVEKENRLKKEKRKGGVGGVVTSDPRWSIGSNTPNGRL